MQSQKNRLLFSEYPAVRAKFTIGFRHVLTTYLPYDPRKYNPGGRMRRRKNSLINLRARIMYRRLFYVLDKQKRTSNRLVDSGIKPTVYGKRHSRQ